MPHGHATLAKATLGTHTKGEDGGFALDPAARPEWLDRAPIPGRGAGNLIQGAIEPMNARKLPADIDGSLKSGPDCIESPELLAFVRIWNEIRSGPDTLPTKEDLDPVLLGRAGLLPFLWLVERQPDGDWRYRLAGESINGLHGHSLRGRTITEVFGAGRDRQVGRRWSFCIDDRMALRTYGRIYGHKQTYTGERIVLPLKGRPAGDYIIGLTIGEFAVQSQTRSGGLGFNNLESDWIPLETLLVD